MKKIGNQVNSQKRYDEDRLIAQNRFYQVPVPPTFPEEKTFGDQGNSDQNEILDGVWHFGPPPLLGTMIA